MTGPQAPPARWALAFALLVLAYLAPEGLGQRWLGSAAAQAALFALFYAVAFAAVPALLGEGRLDAYALERQPGAARALALTLLLALLARAAALGAGEVAGVYAVGPWRAVPGAGPLAAALITTLVPSLAEDIVTRGFLYRALPDVHGARFVLLSSAVYVLNHVFRLARGPTEWVMLFFFGLAYAAALVRTRTLWAAVGLHWGWNLANALADLVVDVDAARPGLTWLVSSGAHLLLLALVLVWPRRGAGTRAD